MLPCYDDIRLPLLAELQCRGGLSRPRDKNEIGQTIYSALANYFSLSQVDLNQKVYEEDGTARSKWENMVRWTRNDLKKQQLLIAPNHGVWAIGDKGLSLLNQKRATLGSPYNT